MSQNLDQEISVNRILINNIINQDLSIFYEFYGLLILFNIDHLDI